MKTYKLTYSNGKTKIIQGNNLYDALEKNNLSVQILLYVEWELIK